MKLSSLLAVSCLFALVAVLGCDGEEVGQKNPEVPTAPAEDPEQETPKKDEQPKTAPEDKSKVLKEGPFELELQGVTFSAPEGWKQTELTERQQNLGFYVARVIIPAEGSNSELTFSVVGGGQQANVGRWQAQYGVATPLSETIDTKAGKVVWVELMGDLSPGAPTPADNTRMLGAAIGLQDGGDLYLKLIGQPEAIKAVRDDFRKFVESASVKLD